MYTGNAQYIEAATAIAREPSITLFLNGTGINRTHKIISVEKDSLNFGGSIIGNVIPQTLTIKFMGEHTFRPEDTFSVAYQFNDISLGVATTPQFMFEKSSYDKGSNQTTVIAKDMLASLSNKKFDATTDGSVTAKDFFDNFCSTLGFSGGILDSPLKNIIMPASPNFSESDNALYVLSKFAEMMCGNAYIQWGSKLCIKSVFPNEANVSWDIQNGVKNYVVEDDITLNRVVISRGDVNDNKSWPETAPETISEYSFVNNPFLDNNDSTDSRGQYIQDLYNLLNAETYTGYQLSYRGYPMLECGDIITVEGGKKLIYYGEKLLFNSSGLSGQMNVKYTFPTTPSFSSGTVRDVLKQVGIKVDKVKAEILMQTSEINEEIGLIEEAIRKNSEQTETLASDLNDIQGKYALFKQDVDGLHGSITSITESLETGVPIVKNTTVDIGMNGVTVGEFGEDVVTNIKASGFYINNIGGGQVADFTREGARIKNVTTKNLNAAGTLFQRFKQNGEWWVGAFWIGEDELWD